MQGKDSDKRPLPPFGHLPPLMQGKDSDKRPLPPFGHLPPLMQGKDSDKRPFRPSGTFPRYAGEGFHIEAPLIFPSSTKRGKDSTLGRR